MSNSAALALKIPPHSPPAPPHRKRRRVFAIVGIAVGSLALLLVLVGALPNEPLRRSIEGKMNRSLKGYSAHIGRARLQPFGFALTLEDVEIRQSAHPEPAILTIPRLRAKVQWKELIFLRVVADFLVDRPRAYVNLEQLRAEAADPVPVKEHGWQQALEAIYPLRINLFRVVGGELTYIDDDPARPLKLTRLELRASNIRNIHSRQRTYPSAVEASAVVFGTGKAELRGEADLLAEPYAGVKGQFRLVGIPLVDIRPVAAHWNVLVSAGTLSTEGEIEFAPNVRRLHLPEIAIEGAKIGYVSKPLPPAAKGVVAASASKAAAPTNPAWSMQLERFRLRNSELEFRNQSKSPGYRLFVSHATADIDGLATEPPGHTARARLHGQFMGSGELTATAVFQPGQRNADLGVKIEIESTPMTTLNDLFRSYGKFDVAAGEFLLNAELQVHNAAMRGYVKPIFRHVEIYDAAQDASKPFLKKVYESVVDAASKVLKNQKHDQIATTTSLDGPIGNAKSSFWEVLEGLIENAFIKAILPGFDHQVGTLRPTKK